MTTSEVVELKEPERSGVVVVVEKEEAEERRRELDIQWWSSCGSWIDAPFRITSMMWLLLLGRITTSAVNELIGKEMRPTYVCL